MRSITDLAAQMERHAPGDGVRQTALPRLTLIRSAAVTTPMPAVYQPSLCLIAQGAKVAQLGDQSFRYDAARFLLAAVDLPVMGTVTEATADAPYLSLCLAFDMAAVAEMLVDHPAPPGGDRVLPA